MPEEKGWHPRPEERIGRHSRTDGRPSMNSVFFYPMEKEGSQFKTDETV
jgi:hypothetical protein